MQCISKFSFNYRLLEAVSEFEQGYGKSSSANAYSLRQFASLRQLALFNCLDERCLNIAYSISSLHRPFCMFSSMLQQWLLAFSKQVVYGPFN